MVVGSIPTVPAMKVKYIKQATLSSVAEEVESLARSQRLVKDRLFILERPVMLFSFQPCVFYNCIFKIDRKYIEEFQNESMIHMSDNIIITYSSVDQRI